MTHTPALRIKRYCQREGARRIGFGECRGTVLPARAA
jgi:fumarylacetoacetase